MRRLSNPRAGTADTRPSITSSRGIHVNLSPSPRDQKRYAITNLNWRSQAATEWLRVFDLIHFSTRFNSNGRAKRNVLPHTHIPSRRVEMPSQLVPRLPSNFYDAAWLLTLEDDVRTKLKMLPEVDLTRSGWPAQSPLRTSVLNTQQSQ
ncbi:hypothetical protein EDD15DRAFT_2158108 [Pisolithus albus]|nr:hypothetical protein EDD15DRAFT_2158108 [Pisolithus albus]